MTSIVTPPAFSLSSNIDDLVWNTDAAEVRVRLYYQHPGQCLIDTTLTAVNGKVRLYETRELIERYMRLKGLPMMYPLNVQHYEPVYWQGDGAMTVIFTEKNIVLPSQNYGVSNWLQDNFLSTMSSKSLPSDEATTERLYFVQPQTTPSLPMLHVTYLDENGKVRPADITLQASYSPVQSLLYACEFSIEAIKQAIPAATEVLAVTVVVDNRCMEYYRPARKEHVAFLFRNAFNVMESAYLNAVVSRKTEDGRKLAHVNGKLAHYDRKPVTEYEVQTSPLSFEEASWIDQLITSPEVTLLDGTPLIITNGDAECHNDNADLNAAKFSFKELDQRHTIKAAEPDANIFIVPPHSYQFS